jgi:DNA-binding NtrC family response regulator
LVPTHRAHSGLVQRIRLLLVDDDDRLLRVMRRYFEKRDPVYEVEVARSADDALMLLQERAFDVVVSDVCMPGLSGCELHAEAMKRWPGLRCGFVFVSGWATDDDRAYIRKTGWPFLSKPVPLNVLTEAVEAAHQAGFRRSAETLTA